MPGVASRIVLASLVLGFAAATPAVAQDDSYAFLKSRGIRQVKGRYILAAESEAFDCYRQAVGDMDAAEQAVYDAGDAADRNQTIINYRNRIAFDIGVRDQMRVEMRDGTTAEEQATRRGARRDLNVAKQQRAMQGLAGAKTKPKEAKRLAVLAEAACQKAASSKSALVDKVREVSGRYQTLATDAEVKQALGKGRLAPSDGFKKLAKFVGVSTKPTKDNAVKSLGGTPRNVTDAITELDKASAALSAIEFKPLPDGSHGDRWKRRDKTVKAIEEAIEKLKQGEAADPKILDQANELLGKFTGKFTPKISEGLVEGAKHLRNATELLGGNPESAIRQD